MALEVGQTAPDFTLRDQHSQDVTLGSFAGQRAVVLVFYPYAFSRVCTGELDDVRDRVAEFVTDDVQLLALSCDPMFTLRAFADADDLKFPLLSDFWPHGAVAQAYGVFNDKAGMAVRGTFLVDAEGKVAFAEVNGPGDARAQTGWKDAVGQLQAA